MKLCGPGSSSKVPRSTYSKSFDWRSFEKENKVDTCDRYTKWEKNDKLLVCKVRWMTVSYSFNCKLSPSSPHYITPHPFTSNYDRWAHHSATVKISQPSLIHSGETMTNISIIIEILRQCRRHWKCRRMGQKDTMMKKNSTPLLLVQENLWVVNWIQLTQFSHGNSHVKKHSSTCIWWVTKHWLRGIYNCLNGLCASKRNSSQFSKQALGQIPNLLN